METSSFNPESQQSNSASKVLVALERISKAFHSLLWDTAKKVGLSPIQIQILIFIGYHKKELSTISHLAKEFNLTKPTISDAVKTLEHKKLLKKSISISDKREYYISLTKQGKNIHSIVENYAEPIKNDLLDADQSDIDNLFTIISKVIYKLNRSGILTVQRTCYGCKFYSEKKENHYCELLKKTLLDNEIRVDCPEYKKRVA